MDVPLGTSIHLDPKHPAYGFDLQGPMLECISELGQRDSQYQKTLSAVAIAKTKRGHECAVERDGVVESVFVLIMSVCQSGRVCWLVIMCLG